mmetsp:Transcript_39958/g.61134  ORF Transcript_39958/g.61134 Transcript_39958/m.61134 type:complete len:189 (-) Transcript_39958:30-596(-)
MKSKSNLMFFLQDSMKIGVGMQRLVMFTFFFLVFCHMICCLWVLIAQLQGMNNTWLETFFQSHSPSEIYSMSIYFAVTTITTVGYGDISGTTSFERLFCIGVMIIGQIAFSFISGSLSSILQNYDSANAFYEEKIQYLNSLTKKYDLSEDLYSRIKCSFKYNYQKDVEEINNLLKELPYKLKMELAHY